MLYNTLKIAHILSATMLLASIAASLRVATQTRAIPMVIPFALIQILTGFTMISLNHYALSDLWIKYSLISFFVLIGSWIAFLSLSNHIARIFFMSLSFTAILSMIFLMANKI